MMRPNPSDGIGQRLKKYRLLAGLSAQKLSDRMDGSISRRVIANIESGAKQDVTVDELIQLSFALQIPPVMLALPVEDPDAVVMVGAKLSAPVYPLVRWFNGETVRPNQRTVGASNTYSTALLRALAQARRQQLALRLAREGQAKIGGYEEQIEEAEEAIAAANDDLRSLGIDDPERFFFYE